MARVSYDPVTIEILWTRLISIVDEAAATFERTCFSNLVRESNDYCVVLTDAKGRSLAQNTIAIPSFIGTLPTTVRHFIARFPLKTLKPGDVMITNDPWMGSGHLPDVNVAVPIFRHGRPIAFAATDSHVADIGGRPLVTGSRELFEEGLRIPPQKLMERGRVNHGLVEIIESNVRTPQETMGDIWGQVSACRMVEKRLIEMLDDTGADIVTLGGHIQGRSEQAMRRAIRAVPNGGYEFEISDDGFDDEPTVIRCRVDIADEQVFVDFTGSSPQIPKAVNVVPNYVFAWTAFTLKSTLSPELPNNDGTFRTIRTFAPEGSILNPRFPAACNARHGTGHLIPPAVMGALAQAAPDKVLAAPGTPLCTLTLTGEHEGRRFSSINFIAAGVGASARRDGLSMLVFPTNVSNTPIEVLEADAPIRVIRREIRRGSGGKGEHRGGDGGLFEFEIVGDEPVMMAFMMNRLKHPAVGLLGGAPGRLGQLRLNGKDIDPDEPRLVRGGDRIVAKTAGGGGFGAAQPLGRQAASEEERSDGRT